MINELPLFLHIVRREEWTKDISDNLLRIIINQSDGTFRAEGQYLTGACYACDGGSTDLRNKIQRHRTIIQVVP